MGAMVDVPTFIKWWRTKSLHRETATALVVCLIYAGWRAGNETADDGTQWMEVYDASIFWVFGAWVSAYGLKNLQRMGVIGDNDTPQNRDGR